MAVFPDRLFKSAKPVGFSAVAELAKRGSAFANPPAEARTSSPSSSEGPPSDEAALEVSTLRVKDSRSLQPYPPRSCSKDEGLPLNNVHSGDGRLSRSSFQVREALIRPAIRLRAEGSWRRGASNPGGIFDTPPTSRPSFPPGLPPQEKNGDIFSKEMSPISSRAVGLASKNPERRRGVARCGAPGRSELGTFERERTG
jgi:hypothetical protein